MSLAPERCDFHEPYTLALLLARDLAPDFSTISKSRCASLYNGFFMQTFSKFAGIGLNKSFVTGPEQLLLELLQHVRSAREQCPE